MGLFSKKDKPKKCRFAHQEGITGIGKGTATDVFLNDEEQVVEFKPPLSKMEPKLLEYNRIKSVNFFTEKEIIEKSKSVVGRAVVGGVLLGPLGAVVGGVSGVGDKKKEQTEGYIEIAYSTREDEAEIKTILLKVVGASIGWSKFMDTLRKVTNTVQEQSKYI